MVYYTTVKVYICCLWVAWEWRRTESCEAPKVLYKYYAMLYYTIPYHTILYYTTLYYTVI